MKRFPAVVKAADVLLAVTREAAAEAVEASFLGLAFRSLRLGTPHARPSLPSPTDEGS